MKEKIIEILSGVREDVDFENETELVSGNILESFDIVDIVSELDDEFEIEIGPKDIEAGKAIVVRRDTREKIEVSLDEITEKLKGIIETMQQDMYDRAKKHMQEHTYEAVTYDEFKDTIEKKPGFVKAMWCGELECELKIKEDTTATSRCMPFEQEQLSDVCVCCGRPAKTMV